MMDGGLHLIIAEELTSHSKELSKSKSPLNRYDSCVKITVRFLLSDCLNASTEMPDDYYSFMQDNSTKPAEKPTIQMRKDNRDWEL